MKIETYEIEEIKSSDAATMAADSESLELVEKLGLKGQKALANPETVTRFPYPRLDSRQALIFGLCFPKRTALSEYRDGIIPLRVLQVAAYCTQCEFEGAAYLEVWSATTPKDDPILVCRANAYLNENYLLARWGESLKSIEELALQAAPILRAKLRQRLTEAAQRVQQKLESLDVMIELAMQTGEEPTPQFFD
jgi:hypothetical protein